MSAARRVAVACVVVLVALSGTGCGGGAVGERQQAQQDVLRYEQEVGELNAAFGQAATTPAAAVARFGEAVRRYGSLDVPALMTPVHARLMKGLRGQLTAARRGLAATRRGDAAGITAAVTARGRAERTITSALAAIAKRAAGCRAALPDCLPPAG